MPSIAQRLIAVCAIVLCGAPAFAQRGEPIPQQLTFTPYHPTGIYDVGETVGWTVTPGPATPTYRYRWTIRQNNAVVLKEAVLDLSGGKATIEIVATQPGMLYVAVQAFEDLAPGTSGGAGRFTGGNTGRNEGFYAVGAAVAPTKIGLSTTKPADFDAFWDGKLAAQASVPINPVLTPADSDVPGVELQLFELDALGSKAHGWIAKPATPGKFPALIQLQYAGVYALPPAPVARRAAAGWLMVNVDSHDKLPTDPSGNVPRGYQAIGNTNRDNSYFLNIPARLARARLRALAARLGRQDDRPHRRQHGRTAESGACRLAAGQHQRGARLRTGGRG